MPDGYCTVDDVRRVFQKAEFTGDLATDDSQMVVDAITSQTEWLEKTYRHHWYDPDGIDEDDEALVPTEPLTRDDEHDIPTHGGFVHGSYERDYRFRENSDALLEAGPLRHRRIRELRHEPKREIRIAFGNQFTMEFPRSEDVPAYTRIRLDRKDVQEVNELHVVNEDGSFTDWVDDSSFDGGVGNSFRGEDYWVRVNNGGVSELYLDVHSMDDEIPSFAGAVYVDIDYGHEGVPQTVRRGGALFAAAQLVQNDEFRVSIPDNGQLMALETKAETWERQAEDLLEVYLREEDD